MASEESGSCLPVFVRRRTGAKADPVSKAQQGGAGTIKLATLRDERNQAACWDLPRNYWLATLFAVHGRPFPFGPLLLYGAFVTAVTVLIILKLEDYASSVKLKALAVPVQTIGLALFLLISFRTQTAYDRWWEGRKCWGAIIHNCNEVGRMAEAYMMDCELARKIITWTSVYAISLKQLLHYSTDMSEVAEMLPLGEMRKLKEAGNAPSYALMTATHYLRESAHSFNGPNDMVTEMDKRLTRIAENQFHCLRIRNTPMPAGYVIHLRAFLFTWLLLVPFAFVASLGWVTIPISLVIGYELLGYEEVGVEVENPFTSSYHALPLDGVIATILTNAGWHLHAIREKELYRAATSTSQDTDILGTTFSLASAPDKPQPAPQPALQERTRAVRAAHILDSSAARRKTAEQHKEINHQAAYNRLGGKDAVLAAVDIFYARLLDDPFVAPFFKDIGMERLKAKQVQFLTYILGGADDYIGKDPTISHRRLHNEKGLRVEHFYAVRDHLRATLQQLGVDEDLIAECLVQLAPMEKTFGCEGQDCIGH